MATETGSDQDRNYPAIGTTASETGGTMATETTLSCWHDITETGGTIWPKYLAQWRPNYPPFRG